MSLLSNAPCRCCGTVRDYIASHLDPHNTLDGSEDAFEVVAAFDDVFSSDGGCGVSVEDMAEYLFRLT